MMSLWANFIKVMWWKQTQEKFCDNLIPICWLFWIAPSMSKENVVVAKDKDSINKVVLSMPYVSFGY